MPSPSQVALGLVAGRGPVTIEVASRSLTFSLSSTATTKQTTMLRLVASRAANANRLAVSVVPPALGGVPQLLRAPASDCGPSGYIARGRCNKGELGLAEAA